MAENIAEDLVYFLEIEIVHEDFLGQIRHWDNLKMATDAHSIWLKNFTEDQLKSVELKSIPFVHIYVSTDNFLFPLGSLLPNKKVPNLLWTPINKALKVNFAGYNHNFFGLNQSVKIQLVPSETETKATALLINVNLANDYIISSASVRLKSLQWLLVDKINVLFLGEPMLPIMGDAFWQKGDFILPLGYDLEFPILENNIAQKINPDGDSWIWWLSTNQYCLIDKKSLQPLSIASWKQTLNIQ
jgi:hypothetical protein